MSTLDRPRIADVVVSMLENGPIVTEILFGQGAAGAMRPGSIVVDTSARRAEDGGHFRPRSSHVRQQPARQRLSAGMPCITATVLDGLGDVAPAVLQRVFASNAKRFYRVD